MGGLTQQFASTFGGFLSAGAVQLALRLILGYLVVIWLAAAYWAFRDMERRTDQPALPYVAAGIVILFSPLLFPLGLLVYRIVRPSEPIALRRHDELSQALLMSEIGEIEQCVGCGRVVQEEWMVCPSCRTELRERCPGCNGVAEFDWLSCAWCGRDLQRSGERAARPEEAGEREPVPVMDEEAAAAGRFPRLATPRVAVAGSGPEAAPASRRR